MATSKSDHQGSVKDPEHDGRLKENREAGRTMGTTEGSKARAEQHGHEPASSHGTGSHGKESHTQPGHAGASHSGSHASKAGPTSGEGDLKSREYKDADGNVHHHTRAYQEGHKS